MRRWVPLALIILTGCDLLSSEEDEPTSTFPITAAFFALDDGLSGPFQSSSTGDPAGVVEAMAYAGIDVGVVPWDGAASEGDRALRAFLEASGPEVRWAASVAVDRHPGRTPGDHGDHPSYLRIDDREVVFVHGIESCGGLDRWVGSDAYVVAADFDGGSGCPRAPDAWYRTDPERPFVALGDDSVAISPGAWTPGSPPALSRDLHRWRQSVLRMESSSARFHLITSFDGWSDGTAIASAAEWASESGFGTYLDVVNARGYGTVAVPEIAAAGDISCDPVPKERSDDARNSGPECRSQETSDLLTARALDAVLALGDTQYEDGTIDEYLDAYDSTWGRLTHITHPVAGNHEYETPGAPGYFEYFGEAAGDPGEGWYSFDVGGWHAIALNSNCDQVGGCETGSAQERWLRDDLAAHPRACTLAFWHHPRWSSGTYGNDDHVADLWNALVEGGADLVLTAHDHAYERVAPVDERGTIDRDRGIRSFVVGTGGRSTYDFRDPPSAATEARGSDYGVLFLRLQPDGYAWEFEPTHEGGFRDRGSGTCHV